MVDIKDILKQYFTTHPSVQLVILYGSFAKGQENQRSDVDIAVAGSAEYPSSVLVDLNLEISKLLNREIDIVDLNSINGTILTQILTSGNIIKSEDTSLYAELIKKMLYFEEDMAPGIRYILDYRREKFLNAE